MVSNPCRSSHFLVSLPPVPNQDGELRERGGPVCSGETGREPDLPGGKLPIPALPVTDYKSETGRAEKNAWGNEGGKGSRLKKKKGVV